MVKIIGNYVEFIYCACGCNKTRSKYELRTEESRKGKPSKSKPKFYIKNHDKIGKILSLTSRLKMSEARKGERNYNFGKPMSDEQKQKISEANKGKDRSNGNPTYRALHKRIRKRLSKPEYCQLCEQNIPKQVACITGIYNDELRNWAWFCIPCHKKWDNVSLRVSITLKNKNK